MRRNDKEVPGLDEIEKIFHAGKVCQLAFSSAPAPYIVTLNYGYRDRVLYFHSATEGRKIDLARKNSQAGFTVAIDQGTISDEEACSWTTRFQSIVGYGVIEFIESLEEKRQAFDLIMGHYSDRRYEYPVEAVIKTALFRLFISEMTAKKSPLKEE